MPSQTKITTSKVFELRIPVEEGRTIQAELSSTPQNGSERVLIALVSRSLSKETDVVTIHSVHPVPPEAYLFTRAGTSWDPAFTAQIAEEGMRLRLGVVIMHSHPFGPNPGLSGTDSKSFIELLRRLQAILPNRPHGSIVFGSDWSAGGLLWTSDSGVRKIGRVRWIGSPLLILPRKIPGRAAQADGEMYDSQRLLIGEQGQALLAQTTIGIVGLGGGGSHVAQQVIHIGPRRLVVVDPDKVEKTNRSRMVGSRPSDDGVRHKTEVIERLAAESNPSVQILSVREKFPSAAGIEALKLCDVVVACVDTLSARAELIDFSWRHLIPLIDIGIGTSVEVHGSVRGLTAAAGHLHVYLPGGPCMWCTNLLTEERLFRETGGKPEYVKGARSPGQVISFNGVVASLAVTEVVQLATGALRANARTQFVQYDILRSTLSPVESARSIGCRCCSTSLGKGDPIW